MRSLSRWTALGLTLGLASCTVDRSADPPVDPIGTTSSAYSVVTNGAFTNVYVMRHPSSQTWEENMAALRHDDAAHFSRASIDAYTDQLMKSEFPSYFGSLFQYSGVNPPQFFGSSVASQSCVDAALADMYNGVMQWDTIRSLSNCHQAGMDPSPQVNLIFAPDIPTASPAVPAHGPDMCSTPNSESAYHAFGLNTPNFSVLPTNSGCVNAFSDLMYNVSHEDVEIVSDPAWAGFGGGGNGEHEAADICQKMGGSNKATVWDNGLIAARYWSNDDQDCQPQLEPPSGSISTTWSLGTGMPFLTVDAGDSVPLDVPAQRVVTDAPATQVSLVVRLVSFIGPPSGSTLDATLTYADGATAFTPDVAAGEVWSDGATHSAILNLPSQPEPVSGITGVTLSSAGGGWTIGQAALVVSHASGKETRGAPFTQTDTWLDASDAPLVRFSGGVHDLTLRVPPTDVGMTAVGLSLVISTGNDDLRGGGNPGDNCNVTVTLASGHVITLTNVNQGQDWGGWTKNTVSIPMPASGVPGGGIRSVVLHTGFGGGSGGDNWNVERVQLIATVITPPPSVSFVFPDTDSPSGGSTIRVDGAGFDTTGGTVIEFGGVPGTNVDCTSTTECIVTDPPGNGEADVTVLVNGRTSVASASSAFAYVPSVLSVTPNVGTVGDEVTIQGIGFWTTGMRIDFGSSPATQIGGCTPSECVVLVPPGAGTVDVTVSLGSVTSDTTPADRFSYVPPTITSVTPNTGAITGGELVVIRGVGFDPTSTQMQVFFGGVSSDYVVCNDGTWCEVRVPPAAQPWIVDVTATVFGVSTATDPGDEFTYTEFPMLAGIYRSGGGGYVTLTSAAPAGGALITLTSSDPTVVATPGSVTIAGGGFEGGFLLDYLPTTASGTVTITASYEGSQVSAPFAYSPGTVTPLVTVTLPPEIGFNDTANVTVTLSTPAPAGGAFILLASSDPSAITVNEDTVVLAGQSSTTFPVTNVYSGAPKRVLITATYGAASGSGATDVPALIQLCAQKACPKGYSWSQTECKCVLGRPQ